jgi:hypothetical protein
VPVYIYICIYVYLVKATSADDGGEETDVTAVRTLGRGRKERRHEEIG